MFTRQKMVIFSCLILFFFSISLTGCATTPSPPLGVEKIESPILNIGERWKFKTPDGYEWNDEVEGIEPNEYLIRVEGSVLRFDKNTMNVIKATIPFWETHGKRLNFPIYLGKKWTYTTRKAPYGQTREVTYLNDFKITKYEQITTPAGKFYAYKIDYKQTNLDSGRSGRIEFWYSPEVKWFVKRRVEPVSYWPSTRWVQDFELVEYILR